MYTAIVSDFHITEKEPWDPQRPFWKRYKQADFFFDTDWAGFLIHLNELSRGEPVELILNGDIFDFDTVTQIPEKPPFKVTIWERYFSLSPEPSKAIFKMSVIIKDHPVFFQALRDFILRGNTVIILPGNHDLEIFFYEVQNYIREALDLPVIFESQLIFGTWFYISNKDTLIEHGNQYDPFCVFENPLLPFRYGSGIKTMLLPFGDRTTRTLINGMGYFNPHVDVSYVRDAKGYIRFFFKYLVSTQPFIMWTWIWRSLAAIGSLIWERWNWKRLDVVTADLVHQQAQKAQVDPFKVLALKELGYTWAIDDVWIMIQELWLDRAFFFIGLLVASFMVWGGLRLVLPVPLWAVLLFVLFWAPFIVIYSALQESRLAKYKYPADELLVRISQLMGIKRIVHGHTHEPAHFVRMGVEYLNSGTWSPGFLDVECLQKFQSQTFVWIYPQGGYHERKAEIREFKLNGLTLGSSPKIILDKGSKGLK